MKALGIGLLILILGYAADIRFLQKKLGVVLAQKIKISQLLQNTNKKTKGLNKPRARQQKIKSPQTQYGWTCDFDSADILNDLEKAAADSQVSLNMIEPQTIKEDEFFVVYPIKIEIAGQYKNLLALINYIFKQPYFIALEELNLQKRANDVVGNELEMQVLINIYKNKMPQTEIVAMNNLAINKPENDIFSKAVGKVNLFLWANRELNFLGTIKQNEGVYGFVSDPTGAVHRVAVGDKIGLKQSEIIAIDERGIKVKNSSGIYRRESE